ncbi:MAG: pyruvate dehydrogenase (acetyl-transferring) E1 component subunit alpha, partial [Alphaproteobacteria bacterium]|nr:pyruvate dehydrogenase (acetyl-transferring) E1 component subunit alpha [Alphaproteobacteria bacterium]
QVYESFNMAALWKLPVIYVIENNRYGMGTSVARASATTDLSHRGQAYGIPGRQVDGMNVATVKAEALDALEDVRAGKGPQILEMMTYRYRGHSMSDPAKYRTKEEVQAIKDERDALGIVKARLLADGMAEEDLKSLEKTVKEIVAEAVEFAQTSPEPDPAELWTDVLVRE